MSYCRWSDDNWKCDLYCYEDVAGGWTTHVAGMRRIGLDGIPPFPSLVGIGSDEWLRLYKAHMSALNALPFEKIELPYAGETFNDDTLEAFEDRLRNLKDLGYHVPDYVIEAVAKERVEIGQENEK